MKIVALPFSGGGLGHGNGANKAPDAIKKELEERFANEHGETPKWDFEKVNLDETNLEESHRSVQSAVAKLTDKAILLGGDHSVTYSAVKGFAEKNKDFWFIVFDAHPDLMQDFVPPTQESYLRALIDTGVVKPEQCIIIGVRNWDEQEIEYLHEKDIVCYTMKDVFSRGTKDIISEVTANLDKPVYLSLDIDVVDPTEAIGTGYIEHGGMSSRELIYSVQELRNSGHLAMVDVVEVNPEKDVKDMTSKLAAKLVVELGDY